MGMGAVYAWGVKYEMRRDLLDATSMHRPDTSWLQTDAAGHVHRWYVGDQPATTYRPDIGYTTPTLVWVKDGEAYWEDCDEPHDIGHNECRLCGEHIVPRYTADSYTQYIPGPARFYIDDEPVTKEVFDARLKEAGL